MHISFIAISLTLAAAPVFAQDTRGFVTGAVGLTAVPDGTSGNLVVEAGAHIDHRVSVFGSVGQYHDLQPSEIQPLVGEAEKSAFVDEGLSVKGTARVPALYTLGGVRLNAPTRARISPYVLAGAGVAWLEPQATFTLSNGEIDGTSSSPGMDVTANLVGLGAYKRPTASDAFMYSAGAGADVLLDRHLVLEGGYRFARVATATPLDAHSLAVGVGYRF